MAEASLNMPVTRPRHTFAHSPETRIPELDGLRGTAILMVILCHFCFLPDLAKASRFSLQVFFFNFFASGVNLFFVLSGFLIGGVLLDHRSSPSYFRTFYGRRIVRIFPVYYGFLFLTGLVGVIDHSRGRMTPVFDAGTPYWMFFVFLQNFSLSWHGDWAWITVTMAWSLALEEQCYSTLPLGVKWFSTKTLAGISCVLIAGAPLVRLLVTTAPHTVGSLVIQATQADALAAGFLCAIMVKSGRTIAPRRLALAALSLAPVVFATHLAGSPASFLRETSDSAFYSCILLLAAQGCLATLRSSVLMFLGTISYSLYVVHESALVMLHRLVRHAAPSVSGATSILTTISALVLSIAICWLSWRYFEKPLLAWARGRFRYELNPTATLCRVSNEVINSLSRTDSR